MTAGPVVPLLLLATALVTGWAGLRLLVVAHRRTGAAVELAGAARAGRGGPGPDARLDALLRATPPGRALHARLRAAGLGLRVTHLLLLAVAAALVGRTVVGALLPGPGAIAGAVVGVGLVAGVLHVRAQRRREAFTAQVTDVASVLANLTFAGLALPGAIAAAPDELAEPARSEIRRLSEALSVGHGLDAALADLAARFPSRELTVLVSTLTVASRTGGDIVGALRGTARTLRARADVRGELRTILASARSNSYGILVLALVFVVVIRSMDPGAFTLLLASPVGLAVFAVAIGLFVLGSVLIRRTTRIEV